MSISNHNKLLAALSQIVGQYENSLVIYQWTTHVHVNKNKAVSSTLAVKVLTLEIFLNARTIADTWTCVHHEFYMMTKRNTWPTYEPLMGMVWPPMIPHRALRVWRASWECMVPKNLLLAHQELPRVDQELLRTQVELFMTHIGVDKSWTILSS